MSFKLIVRDVFTLFVLIVTFLVSTATSYHRAHFDTGTFLITSDCVAGNLEETVEVSGFEIINPSTLSFLDFGFPVAIINPDVAMTGVVGSATRTCKRTYGGETPDRDLIFSCYDTNDFSCSILIQKP